MKISKNGISLLSASVAALLLGGCGSSSDNDDNPTYAPPPPPAAQSIEFPVQQSAAQVLDLQENGEILVTENGLSLYFFANDQAQVSNCNGVEGDEPGSTTDPESCAGIWPPLLATENAQAQAPFSLIDRDSGTKQWAYNGYALYTFANDAAQGDINGDGVNGIWDLARPDPVALTQLGGVGFYVGSGVAKTATSNNQVLEFSRQEKAGFSLYTFDADPVNDANCYNINDGGCINIWPPLLADGGAKPQYPLEVLTLSNGEKQWAYRGKPLYFFVNDNAPGDTAGDGINMVWHLATDEPAAFRNSELGDVLSATGIVSALLPDESDPDTLVATTTDKDQFTLYTFDNDTPHDSNCIDMCAVIWPAFLANEADQPTGNYTIFTRDDGLLQWAWNQQPLYFFDGDTEKKQANGEGFNGVWHVIPKVEMQQNSAPVKVTETMLGQTITVSGQVKTLNDDGQGNFIVEEGDLTDYQLYTFDVDEIGVSNCNSVMCKSTWPALLAEDGEVAQAPYSIIERSDGHMQWALNGMPLYLFVGDTQAGQQNGEQVNNVWWVARPAPLRVYEHQSKDALLIGHGQILPSVGKTAEQLVDLTLYTFDDDVPYSGESTCFGSCASTWPPLYANSSDEAFGDYQIIERQEENGESTLQWTYKGLPLYFFTSDSQLGDTFGDYPTWTIARP